jgi:hypothetical protein
MTGDFSYKKKKGNGLRTIQKHTFPRFRATFDYKTPLPELIMIKFTDTCEPKDIARALSELDVYMKSIRKEIKK